VAFAAPPCDSIEPATPRGPRLVPNYRPRAQINGGAPGSVLAVKQQIGFWRVSGA